MAVASRRTSTLNPNAPLFIPLAYQQVEDFSPEWWNLVKSSPWFRDYWLRERYETFDDGESFADLLLEEQGEDADDDEFSELEEALLQYSTAGDEDVFEGTPDSKQESTEGNEKEKDLVLLKALNGKPAKPRFEIKNLEKPPHIVAVKTSPRIIQQPR